MWSSLRKFVTSFCSESSVHGVKYLIKDKSNVSRCYWCVMLIFALYCCGQFSVLLSRRFLEIPIRMTIRNGQARTEQLPLPSVTFCSENPPDHWYKQVLGELEIPPEYSSEDLLEAMRLVSRELTPRFVPDQQPLNETLVSLLDHVLVNNNIMTREFVARMSVPCDVLLSHCQLRGVIMPCADLFQRVNGQCCRFYDDPDTFVSSGNRFHNNLKVVTSTGYGAAYLMVHGPMTEPLMEQSTFTMRNGYYVMYFIDPLRVEKSEEVHEMEEELQRCVHADEQELRFFESYNYLNCAMELMINASMALCGCAGAYTPAPDEYTCNFTRMNCLRKYPSLNKMDYEPIRGLSDLAAKEGIEMQTCLEECTYTLYTQNFMPRLLVPEHDCTGFLSDVNPKKAYVVHFTYEYEFYKIQEFVLITDWISLLSNLGGVYGLFLGCSMLTLVELAFYLWTKVLSKMSASTNRVLTSTSRMQSADLMQSSTDHMRTSTDRMQTSTDRMQRNA